MRETGSNDEPDVKSDDEPPHDVPSDDELSAGGASPDGTALSEDPVITNDPELPNDQAPEATLAAGATGASAEFNDQLNPDQAAGTRELNWMGYVAFATGALALSIVAIVLGHLGLSAVKRGRAHNRDFALAGLILGYIGLVVTAVGLWFLLGDQTTPAHVDVQAQQDVSAVGAAAATAAVETGEVPQVTVTETGYMVSGGAIDAHLDGERTLTLTGESFADWCLQIAYEGGEQTAFSYSATTGMAQGRCAP